MIGAPEELAGEIAAPLASPLVGEIVQAGPLAPLPPDFYALPRVPDWCEGITTRQRAYIEAYLGEAGFNSAAAARIAKLSEGYAARLRSDPRIQRAIEKAMMESSITRLRILEEITALALSSLSDIAEIIDSKMVVRDTAKMSEQARRSLSNIKCDPVTGAVISVSADSKLAALNLLAKAIRLVGNEPAIAIQGNNIQVVLSKEDQQVL